MSGHTDAIALARTDLALEWETLTDVQLELAAQAAVIDYGGKYIPAGQTRPGRRGHSGPVEHELDLLGVTGTGPTLATAVRNWIKHILRMVQHDAEAELAA